MATKKTHNAKSKNDNTHTLNMSKDQETFIPHWIVRFSDDFVADVCDKKPEANTRESFISVVVNALNVAYGLDLNAQEYDFGAKKSRSETIARLQAKAEAEQTKSDNSSADWLKAINDWYDNLNEAFKRHDESNDEKLSDERKKNAIKATLEKYQASQYERDVLKAFKLYDEPKKEQKIELVV